MSLAMIGVLTDVSQQATAREFFELFKTPWEFYQPGRSCSVLLCVGDAAPSDLSARLIVIYSGHKLALDDLTGIEAAERGERKSAVQYRGVQIPIYGDLLSFAEEPAPDLLRDFADPAIRFSKLSGNAVIRIGYDLFGEVHRLLTSGQPVGNAAIPTLDWHIALLRELLVASGEVVAEIPPVPEGYQFLACLTHDVDHPMLRPHRFDATMFGFLYRATCGTLSDVLRKRKTWSNLWQNSLAALKLPLVYLGLAKDPWCQLDRYVGVEQKARSTYFVIPFEGRHGRTAQGMAPKLRAARYGAADISEPLCRLTSAGCEIGLHGIDAWMDAGSAKEEMDEVRAVAGAQEIGVRMHWLYFDDQSPAKLEQAGASYDSTVGYNETVGYRAGTAQAYAPPRTLRLLELPLHIMDTALFYPGHLGLTDKEASVLLDAMIGNALQSGGCLTINWHDRSIAPERLWGNFYARLVAELKQRGAWLSSARQAVAWFRKRRSARLGEVQTADGEVQWRIAGSADDGLPGMLLRIHYAPGIHEDTRLAQQADSSHRQDTIGMFINFPRTTSDAGRR